MCLHIDKFKITKLDTGHALPVIPGEHIAVSTHGFRMIHNDAFVKPEGILYMSQKTILLSVLGSRTFK